MKLIINIVIFSLLIAFICADPCASVNQLYCNDCDSTGNTCNTCHPGIGTAAERNPADKCRCKTNYTDKVVNNAIVGCKIECDHQCETCDEGAKGTNVCKTCGSSEMLLPKCLFLKKGNYITNPTAPLKDQNTASCAPYCSNCVEKADNCIQVGNTPKCNGQNRDENTCKCKLHFYDNEGKLSDCEECPQNCVECTHKNMCSKCDEAGNKVLNQFTGKCECIPGWRIFDEKTQQCEPCFMLSDVCVQKCPQNTVQNEKFKVCETLEYEMLSNATLIVILGVLIGILQVALCCFVYICLKRKHEIMESELFQEQMKIKDQRNHIYKNMDGFNQSMMDNYSKSGVSPVKQRGLRSQGRSGSNLYESQNDLSHSNLQSSQINLFTKDQQVSNKPPVLGSQNEDIQDLDDIQSGQEGSSSILESQVGKRRRRNRQ